jgi:hypothetical protein
MLCVQTLVGHILLLSVSHVQSDGACLPPGELERFLVHLMALPFMAHVLGTEPSAAAAPDAAAAVAAEAVEAARRGLALLARLDGLAKPAIAAAAVPAFRKVVASGNAAAAPQCLAFAGKLLRERPAAVAGGLAAAVSESAAESGGDAAAGEEDGEADGGAGPARSCAAASDRVRAA